MRILFLHGTFPGPFRWLAHALGAQPEHTVLFLSETGRKVTLPGVRRLRLAPPRGYACEDPAEQEAVLRCRRAARVGNALLGLRRDGFVPDLICASAGMGGSFYLRDIFPRAFYMAQADWFYSQGESHCFFTRGRARPAADFAPARVRNLWEYNALGDCDLAVASSGWQRDQYPDFLAQRIQVVHSGINTRFFSPAPGERFACGDLDLSGASELITFSGPLHDAARGCAQFMRCLPRLLQLRPACRVLVAWPEAASRSRERDGDVSLARRNLDQQRDALPLSGEERARVHLLGPLPLQDYRRMLRSSTAHVYLTAPYALSTGILEALACGGLIVGSDTAPVREVLTHGANGFLCDFWDAERMAEIVAGVAERAPRLAFVRQAARQTVEEEYNAAVQTERLRCLLRERMERKGQSTPGPEKG